MKTLTASILCLLTLLCLGHFESAAAQGKTTSKQKNMETTKKQHIAKGSFEVKVTPLPAEENIGDPMIGRLSLDKTYSGDITATAKGQMLGIGTAVKESGGYVAAERVIGTVNEKKGSFSLQHTGTMRAGKFDLKVDIVPDSGTDELKGISGSMKIIIEGGKHLYELSYTLP